MHLAQSRTAAVYKGIKWLNHSEAHACMTAWLLYHACEGTKIV